jgi:hypothetical protein
VLVGMTDQLVIAAGEVRPEFGDRLVEPLRVDRAFPGLEFAGERGDCAALNPLVS